MMHNCMRPVFGKNPEFYAMSCTECGWEGTFELDPCEMTEVALPGAPPDTRHHVTELPKTCPKCGARLKKTKRPVMFRN